MQLRLHPFELRLRSPFRIAHETRTTQPTLIVELFDEASGHSGFGEAPLTRYYGLTTERETATLEKLAPAFSPFSFESVEKIMQIVDGQFVPINTFLRCAIDVAAHDLAAKIAGERLGAMWEQPDKRVPTCYTIGFGPVEEMIVKLQATPWPVYKIKLGKGDDLMTVRALREHTESPFYVDANTGWTSRQAIDLSGPLAELGVVFLEQPLPPADLAGQREVKKHSILPVLADESCQTEADVDRCADHFHGINIKVVKCGGLAPARRMIARAREVGLTVMAGCMTESSVGISAIAQLLPELDHADLDGAMLIANDPARGVTFDPVTGFVNYPNRPGTGAELLS